MTPKPFLPFTLLVLAVLACSLPGLATPPDPGPVPATGAPTPPAAGLNAEMLRNATYYAPSSGQSVTLVDGFYQSGDDPAAADFLTVSLGELIAFGDLNFDGVDDAVVVLGENTGGTGVFVSLVAVLNVGGAPVQAASVFVDDRPILNSLSILDGEVLADAIIHAEMDPGCCPAFQTRQGYRLYGEALVTTRWVTWTPGGLERAIHITAPADLAGAAYPLTVSGGVTVGPFENNLAYNVYAPDNTLVAGGSVMTDSPEPGAPGDFTLTIDLSSAGVYGLVRIEFAEFSMADGSLMALDSVLVDVH